VGPLVAEYCYQYLALVYGVVPKTAQRGTSVRVPVPTSAFIITSVMGFSYPASYE